MFIPLRYKFLLVVAVILLIAVMSFLYLATRLFDADKKAYIYDNNAALVGALAEEVNTGIQSVVKTLGLVGIAYTQEGVADTVKQATIRDLFMEERSLVGLAIYTLGGDGESRQLRAEPDLQLENEAFLAPYELPTGYLQKVRATKPLRLANVLHYGVAFQNSSLPDGIPLLTVAISFTTRTNPETTLVIAAELQQNDRMQMFARSSVYTTYMIDHYGQLMAHGDHRKLLEPANRSGHGIIDEIIASPVQTGAREYVGPDGASYIAAYRKLPQFNLIVVSEIAAAQAYAASARLIEKSVLFAILILSLSLVVSILFTRRLTSAMQRLYLATQRIGRGDFNVQVEDGAKDEVGALSRAFNRMAVEIMRLLKETAEKARMEKELETAQLVQDNFFPPDNVEIGDVQIASYFKPASECGGDWWGYFRLGDSLVVMLGDATGHGVGAALITAAAHSCMTSLEWLHKQAMIKDLSPRDIMACLNAAVFDAGKNQVKMTFFVGVLDLKTGVLRYCNASHEMPLVMPPPRDDSKLTKADLEALTGMPDPCLGQDIRAEFHEHVHTLEAGHTLIMHTDGLTECGNADQEEFGERRLIRALLASAPHDAAGLRDSVVEAARSFYGEQPEKDDVTLVIIKRKPQHLSAELPKAV